MSTTEDRIESAKKFVEEWQGRGYEKADDQTFWNQFLSEVIGIGRVHHEIEYQKPVRVKKSTNWLDAYIASSKTLIEQKSIGVDLSKPERQSDGEGLTPYEQALKYATYLPAAEAPDFIITSNFESFRIYDRRTDPNGEAPVIVTLEELPSQLQVFDFIINPINAVIEKQTQVSKEAAEIIGLIYTDIRKQYLDPDKSGHDLAVLMVRILFCLYAEDGGLFERGQFYNYLKDIPAGYGMFKDALAKLFKVLDTPVDERNLYPGELVAEFPYVNGGLFKEEIEIPIFTDEIKNLMLSEASKPFDWSQISPVIFGSIFESILSGDERRAGGMHYTSVENIRKLIDPLFLDEIVTKLRSAGNDKAKLRLLQDEIADLKFLDPACGSGNFLTQTYIELRRIENRILTMLADDGLGRISMELSDLKVKVNVGQFYGIEINEFAVAVANTALWIADHQANVETSGILARRIVNLPLVDYKHIVAGNALRINWENVVLKTELNYILGNPPFIGHQWRNAEQIEDMEKVYADYNKHGKLDYVCSWYKKAADFIKHTRISVAFVSTNSIVQGESVATMWKPLFDADIEITFAYHSFLWSNETKGKAAVFCVIIGFANKGIHKDKYLFIDSDVVKVKYINAYLLNAPNVFIQSRGKPLLKEMPIMSKGSQPTDGGNLLLSQPERDLLIHEYPNTDKWIRRYMSGDDFINNNIRYCLWLKGIAPADYRTIKPILQRLELVAESRKKSPTASVRQDANTPMLFTQIRHPETKFLAVPIVSSERRRYIPIGYLEPEVIASDQIYIVPNATLYLFGILTSSVHMAWVRVFCGRLKRDYRYSPALYNNFPWPDTTDEQKTAIEKQAQTVLDARALFLCNSLADLYDPLTMPPELLKAHQTLDRAVMKLYGGSGNWKSEADCVTALMKIYQKLTEEQ